MINLRNNSIWFFGFAAFVGFAIVRNCDSPEERKQKEIKRQELRLQRESELEANRLENARRSEQEELARKARLEQERIEQEIQDRYISNSLQTGATPYRICYGGNRSCSQDGCSEIRIKTPFGSDVIVIIKKADDVVRHAYIRAGDSYTFQLPNGTYQPFFYYGKGWNPDKFMKETSCGSLYGGFVSNEVFSKDYPQLIEGQILTYELTLRTGGNFSTKGSSLNEAL